MIKAIMHGCNGHMGQTITRLIAQDPAIEIVAGIDKNTSVPNTYPVFENISDCDIQADVIIDFCAAPAVDALLDYAVDKKLPILETGIADGFLNLESRDHLLAVCPELITCPLWASLASPVKRASKR